MQQLDIIKGIDVVSPTIDYWFVRTDSGENYETFKDNGFIGIGWNYITLDDITKKTSSEVIEKIARREKYDVEIAKQKGKATGIYNKIMKFSQLKKGDVVIIPSYKSSRLSFGIVAENGMTIDTEKSHHCNYYKRKKVDWKVEKYMSELDKTFFLVKRSQHSISSVGVYAEYIDSVIHKLYKKDGYSHLVLNVQTHQEINWLGLGTTLVEMHELMAEISATFGLNEDVQNSSIRLNLQSPGILNFKQAGAALLLLAMVLGSASCNTQSQDVQQKVTQIQANQKPKIDSINTKLASLQVDIP